MSYHPVEVRFDGKSAEMRICMDSLRTYEEGVEIKGLVKVDAFPPREGIREPWVNVSFEATETISTAPYSWRNSFHQCGARLDVSQAVELRDKLNAALAEITPEVGEQVCHV